MLDITFVLVLVISASLNPVLGDDECKLPTSKVKNFDHSKRNIGGILVIGIFTVHGLLFGARGTVYRSVADVLRKLGLDLSSLNLMAENIIADSFQGLWHIVSSNNERFSKEEQCWDDLYKMDGDIMSMEGHYKRPDGTKMEATGTIKYHGDSPSFKLHYEDPSFKAFNGEFEIFATDYTDYAIMAACVSSVKNLYYIQYRERKSNNKQQTPDAVKEALKSVGMDDNKFIPNCGTS